MIKMTMIDLHTHSSASDGSLSPGALIKEAVKRSLTAIALTDHDTIAGLKEAEKAALELGIKFIPGIELEITWNKARGGGGEFHLLGLGINNPSPDFIKTVENLAKQREERNLEIVEKMNNAGIKVSYQEIKALAAGTGLATGATEKAGGVSIGRPHFADFLIKQKIVKNREQAFSRYLGGGKLFYIPKIGLDFDKAVEIIKQSGGIAVLAHPMSLYTAWGRLPDLIENLKDKGLDGIEAWHPTAKVSSCKRLEELGKKLGLYISAGSDFHGEARPDRKLGITAGGKKIEDSYLPKHNLSN
ncbi:MAG: PHP domain-containing protein [Treponema sp.]|nr:PHP domain-containing protein [Treponema sp.]